MKLTAGAFCFATLLSLLPAVQSTQLGSKWAKNERMNGDFEELHAEELDAFALTLDLEQESAEFWTRHLQASSRLTVLPTPAPTIMSQPLPQPTPPLTEAGSSQPQPTPPPTMVLPRPTQVPTTIGVIDRCAAVTCTNPIEGCDPLDGLCKPIDAVVPCIAIIDESSQSDSYITGLWDSFRAQYPDRPFCLLRPVSDSVSDRLYLPPSFVSDSRTTFANVSRDDLGADSVVPGISDWFNICGFGIYQGSDIQYIGKFLDTSGSMTLSTVQASNDLFLASARNANLEIREVFNGLEDWITPFLTTLVPSSGRRKALRRSLRKYK